MNTTSHLRFPCFLLDLAPRPIDASSPLTVHPPVPNSRPLSSVTHSSGAPRDLPGSTPLNYDSTTVSPSDALWSCHSTSILAGAPSACFQRGRLSPITSRKPYEPRVAHGESGMSFFRNPLPNFLHFAEMTQVADGAHSREETPRMVR